MDLGAMSSLVGVEQSRRTHIPVRGSESEQTQATLATKLC